MKPRCKTSRAFKRHRVNNTWKWTCAATTRATLSMFWLKRVNNTGKTMPSGVEMRERHHV
eukprot:4301381-Lingulodinium_polyedra.AAC.1